ncbi:MAG TPA: 2-amino-4-hydroxy-6-hydroxymethyldihydropteridine diphosphokinase [Chthoniobacterales bacterium]|jgi:2-amino-4-hydroxy-6-hydroxymethyldihydropteridine diphosphokinase|nr:2-amino-4-hydroxy-6-hydroxymethyldihydropteridine diphosphokinase [Chthoniobacterales bacterium]
MRVGIALGSNLGDRMANLRVARRAIDSLASPLTNPRGSAHIRRSAPVGPVVDLVGSKALLVSPVYETEPIDCEPGAEKFLNAVLEIEYDGDPTGLLEHMVRIEESLGRMRDHARNVSRKIDIDLLYADELNVENELLQLPHPRMHLRKFVLQPLADIRSELVLPGQSKPVRELLAQLKDSATVTRFAENW